MLLHSKENETIRLGRLLTEGTEPFFELFNNIEKYFFRFTANLPTSKRAHVIYASTTNRALRTMLKMVVFQRS